MSMANTRLPGVDAFRILGALLVIGLHVGLFPEWPVWLMEISRASGRWVVPFFFLAMGYFVGVRSEMVPTALASAGRLLQIVLFISVVFALLLLLQLGPRQMILRVVQPEAFIRGVWVHLWFLHAALLALLLVACRHTWLHSRFSWPILLLGLFLCSAADSLFALKLINYPAMFVTRFIAGLFLVWVGIKLGIEKKAPFQNCALPFLAGLLLMLIQASVVRALGGQSAELQFHIGAMILGGAILTLGISLSSTSNINTFADWGRRYALGLYLLHPLAIEVLRTMGIVRSDMLWLLAIFSTMFILVSLERYLPAVKILLDGNSAGGGTQRAALTGIK